jgi:hypothetical protein
LGDVAETIFIVLFLLSTIDENLNNDVILSGSEGSAVVLVCTVRQKQILRASG